MHGTPEQVREQLEALAALGANHLLLNPVARYTEQVEALAEVVGLSLTGETRTPAAPAQGRGQEGESRYLKERITSAQRASMLRAA